MLAISLTTILDRGLIGQLVTVDRSQEHSTGTVLDSRSVLVVINCTQEKKSGAPSCPQEKVTGALLFSGEGNWYSSVFTTGALRISGEGITVLH